MRDAATAPSIPFSAALTARPSSVVVVVFCCSCSHATSFSASDIDSNRTLPQSRRAIT